MREVDKRWRFENWELVIVPLAVTWNKVTLIIIFIDDDDDFSRERACKAMPRTGISVQIDSITARFFGGKISATLRACSSTWFLSSTVEGLKCESRRYK